jgi:ATP-dependent exoDNAse (exonuclease V) alpha subunit
MPAGTRAVTAYKAYTAASRHRQVSYLVASDGAERREIAAHRPLGDPRPIRPCRNPRAKSAVLET